MKDACSLSLPPRETTGLDRIHIKECARTSTLMAEQRYQMEGQTYIQTS